MGLGIFSCAIFFWVVDPILKRLHETGHDLDHY